MYHHPHHLNDATASIGIYNGLYPTPQSTVASGAQTNSVASYLKNCWNNKLTKSYFLEQATLLSGITLQEWYYMIDLNDYGPDGEWCLQWWTIWFTGIQTGVLLSSWSHLLFSRIFSVLLWSDGRAAWFAAIDALVTLPLIVYNIGLPNPNTLLEHQNHT